jgi:hypothetical protein
MDFLTRLNIRIAQADLTGVQDKDFFAQITFKKYNRIGFIPDRFG